MSASEIQAFTVAEVAKTFEVTPPTVYKWIRNGRLDEMRLTGGSIILVSAKSVKRLKEQREAVQAVVPA